MKAHTSLQGVLLLGMFIVSLVPTQMAPATINKRSVFIAVPVTTLLFLASKDARALANKARYKSEMVALQVAQHCPLSANKQEWIAAKLEEVEALYATRSWDDFIDDKLMAVLKDFQVVWGATKAGKEFYELTTKDPSEKKPDDHLRN